jgi:uncharacterized protein (TIGR02646 family)
LKFIPKCSNDKQYHEAQNLLNQSRRYNSSSGLKSILRTVYSGLCAYCESNVEHNSFFQIEHFYPKAKYRNLAKEYRNLHYCCQRCNNLKGSKDPINIFSPNYYFKNNSWNYSDKQKIEEELIYSGPFLFSNNKNVMSIDRGNHTINMFDLNARTLIDRHSSRRYLLEMRIREYNRTFGILKALYELMLNYNPKLNNAINVLFDELLKMIKPNYPYSTMIIHNYGLSIVSLIKIYNLLKIKHSPRLLPSQR